MNPALAIAASGMRFADTSLAAYASNTANLLSDGYKARVVSGRDVANGGVTASVRTDDSPGLQSFDPSTGGTTELSNVNLEDAMIGTRVSTFMYAANAAVIRAEDAAVGSLLNRLA